MGRGALWRDNQQSTFAHIHTSSSHSTTSPRSPIPYSHCVSTVGLPRGADGADADGMEWSPFRAWGDSSGTEVARRPGAGARFSADFAWAEGTGLHVGPSAESRVGSDVADARQTNAGADAGCRGRLPVSTVVA